LLELANSCRGKMALRGEKLYPSCTLAGSTKAKWCVMNRRFLNCYATSTTAQMEISTWELLYNRFEVIQPKMVVGLLF